MPIDGKFAAQDYDTSRFSAGAIPRTPDGGVELTRTNAILDQWLRDLEADGAPFGWALRAGPQDEGYDVYLGETIAGMARYNTSPIDGLDDAYQFNKGVTAGGRRPTKQTPDIAVLKETPADPTVKKVEATIVGYEQGTYLAAKSIVATPKGNAKRKSHTRLTNTVEFDVDTDGKALEWQASQDLPKEAYGEGLWLSEPAPLGGTPDPSTLRLQAIRPKGGRTYTTRGPLKLGSHARKPPKLNETKINKPKKLKWGQDMKIRGGLGHDLQPMRMKASIVVTTAQGESLASDASDPITISKERPGHGIMFDPKHLHPAVSGFKIFVQVDDVDNPPWYQIIRTEKGDKFRRFARINKPVLFGYIDSGSGTVIPRMPDLPEEDKDNDEKKEKRDAHENRHYWLLAAGDPPTEDGTGIEDPTGDIDPPIPTGLGRPGAGTWYVAFGRRFDGKPTQTSRPIKVTITASQVIELRFPPRVNRISNALYGQLDQKGIPTGWTFTKQDTTQYTTKDAQMDVEPGKLYLRTSGSPTTNDRYPRAVSWDTSDVLNTLAVANPGQVERIRLTLEVAEYSSGRAFVEVAQYNDAGTALGALTLATLSQNGFVYVDVTIGSSGLTTAEGGPPDVLLDQNADYVGIRWGIENGGSASRNLKMSVYNLFWHPFDAHPRRFEDRTYADELWQPSIDPGDPIPASHVLAIGPAPPTAGDVQNAPAPLNTVTHSGGTVTVGAGTLPTGWAAYPASPGTELVRTIESTTRFGSPSQNAARFDSDNLNALTFAYFHRNYQPVWPGGNALAMRFLCSIEQLPSKVNRSVQIALITADDSSPMAWFQLWHDGTLELHTYNFEYYERQAVVQRNLRAGDVIDAEIIVGGGGSDAGIASTYIGVNGRERSAGAFISGIDWTSGRTPRRVQYGGFYENQPDQRWAFWFDDVVVTLNGYAGVIAPPATGPTPMPDRPQNGAGNYRDTAPDGETINQGYAFYMRSDVLEGIVMGHETDEFFVKPGVQRTAAIFLKPQDFPAGQRIFVLAAYNEAGDRIELGCLTEQTGANAIQNLTEGWYEFWMAYTPPTGFFRLRWEHEGTTGGTYVWQEPVDAVGNLDTLAERDAARVEARATSATFSIILEARVPGQEGTNMENGWLEERKAINVSAQVPEELLALNPPAVTWRARSSDRTDVWNPYQTDESLIPDLKYVDVEVTLRGDGTYSPIVPAGGVQVVYSTYQPILCRENRTAVWGGALIGGDSESNLPQAVNRHDYDTEAVGGIALARATTDRIKRLVSFGVRVYTKEAEAEIADNMVARDLNDIAELVDWFIEDWYENLMQRIRFYSPGDFTPEIDYEFLERRVSEMNGRRIPRIMEVEQTQVLEAHFLE